MTEWRKIDEFPTYSISDEGWVRHDDLGHILRHQVNQQGIPHVGLVSSRDGIQYKRGIALLVAKAFLPPPFPEHFDTPINLDGDRFNNRIDNLMWRPRWFAIKYHKQFKNNERGFNVPVIETTTMQRFETSWEAATTFGLLDKEILLAFINRTYVFPTGQRFEPIEL